MLRDDDPAGADLDGTDLDDDDYLDFLIAGYDPDEDPPDPHDRFPRTKQPATTDEETGPANPEPPAEGEGVGTEPDDPPPF